MFARAAIAVTTSSDLRRVGQVKGGDNGVTTTYFIVKRAVYTVLLCTSDISINYSDKSRTLETYRYRKSELFKVLSGMGQTKFGNEVDIPRCEAILCRVLCADQGFDEVVCVYCTQKVS